MNADILISGGGIAGLTAAAAFGSAGFSVVIVDPTPPVVEPESEGADLRTTAFLQPAQRFLEKAGLWSKLTDHAAALRTMAIVDASGSEPIRRAFVSDDISEMPFGWNLPNWLLRREMVQRLSELPNVNFLAGVGFVRMLARSSGVQVWLSDGSKVRSKLVIGADGRNSPVRESCGIAAKTTRYGQRALTFAVTHDVPHDNVSTEIHQSGGPFTLVPLPDLEGKPRSAVVWMNDNASISALQTLDEDTFNAQATERSAGVLGSLTLVTRRTSWPIISQTADRLTAERTALVAEAAHVMPPIGAQGLNMSLADLSCLLDLVIAADDPGDPRVLEAYERKRHGDIKLRVAGVDALNRASIAGAPLVQDVRRFGIRALHDLKPLRTTAMRLGLGATS